MRLSQDEILALADLLARATKGARYREAQCMYAEGDGTHKLIARFYALEHNVSWPEMEANAALAAQAPAMAETLLTMQAELEAERAAREKAEAASNVTRKRSPSAMP